MLISVEDLKTIYDDLDFSKFSDARLKMKLEAIENTVRELTHNNFVNNAFKTSCYVISDTLYGDFSLFKVGDTIQLTDKTGVNNGLYVIEAVAQNYVVVDKELYESKEMKAYRVDYPMDLIDGCVMLLDYDCNNTTKKKKGIASETISRHSVSYVQYNASNTRAGYPSELLDFVRKYEKWRT